MERTKQLRARFRAQHIPLAEMYDGPELDDLQQAFLAVSQGEDFVNMLSLKTLFSEMGIFPTDDMLNELLKSCGKYGDEDVISFELFARTVALLMEEQAEKGSISSHQDVVYEDQEYEGEYAEEGEYFGRDSEGIREEEQEM